MIGLLYYLVVCFFSLDGVYGPTCLDFPMLDGKGDTRLDVALLDLGASSTVSYGMTDNLFVQAEAFYKNDGVSSRYYGQVASGWYSNYDNRIVELFGGVNYGYGNCSRIDIEKYGNYATCFLQGNYGWKGLANSHIDVALGTKLGYTSSSLSVYDPIYNKTYERYFQGLLFEPAVNFRFGWEKLKFNLKIGQVFGKASFLTISDHPRFELSLNYHFKSGNRE